MTLLQICGSVTTGVLLLWFIDFSFFRRGHLINSCLNISNVVSIPINREVEIKAGCGVRLRIIGITIETELKAVGSIKDDCLGKISD